MKARVWLELTRSRSHVGPTSMRLDVHEREVNIGQGGAQGQARG